MTVVPSPDLTQEAYAESTSECRVPSVMGSWVTNSSQTLDVDVKGPAGTVSVNAWPGSCEYRSLCAGNLADMLQVQT